MALPSLKLLQIGDIHWPGADPRGVDSKDAGFDPVLGNRLVPNATQVVLRHLMSESYHPDAIVLMGDLADKGAITSYQECLDKIITVFGDDLFKILIACGNHDVDRSRCSDNDLFQKFDPLNDVIRHRSLPEMSTRAPVFLPLTGQGHQAILVSLNSCMGCGVKRRFINQRPPKALEWYTAYRFRAMDRRKDRSRFEELDTPAFHGDHLLAARSQIQQEALSVLPIVVAHHNILPQETPRLMAYGELVNGGLARSYLLSLDRPILYLHGHIHEDPIEVVATPGKQHSRLITVSAPPLRDGFNMLTVEYSSSGYPLGCRVDSWRRERGGCVSKAAEIRVRFWEPGDASAVLSPQTLAIMRFVAGRGDQEFHFSDITESGLDMPDSLLELEWLGLIEITNRQGAPYLWLVRRSA